MALHNKPVSFEPYKSYAEYLRDWAFRASADVAMRRDVGKCVYCGAQATEVHHLRYCRWGFIDPPSHMVAICHRCHCDTHGKKH
jgi:5-methylcytosine-specific restriction endonuclease McrA